MEYKSNWFVTFLAVIMTIITLTANLNTARADLPPEPWHCASQDNCLGILQDNHVLLTRKGVLKGTIPMGSGEGTVSISNGWIIVSRDQSVHLYNLVTGYYCSPNNISEKCYSGVVREEYAFVACPQLQYVKKISLDCTTVENLTTGGRDGRYMAEGVDRVFLIHNNEIYFTYFLPTDPTHIYRAYHNVLYGKSVGFAYDPIGPNLLFFNNGTTVYSKPVEPPSDDMADIFYTLPSGSDEGYLTSTDTHVLVSSGGGQYAYIVDIATKTEVPLDVVNSAWAVALSEDTAWVTCNNPTGVRAFDLSGNERSFSPILEPAWWIAYAKPSVAPVCQNGLIEPGETCDGSDFDGKTCADFPGFDGGELACSTNCQTIFTSGCWKCGDGVMNPGETCDGTDFGGATCQDAGFETGELACTANCTVDYSGCSTCGNLLIEGTENCEGADLQGATCSSVGFVSGTLSCGADCMYDTAECSMCGNNIADAGETCDGEDTPGQICQTMGFTGGTLLCSPDCNNYITEECYSCGDGNVNLTEQCDGANLGGNTCETLGFSGGTLSCFENCEFNISQCEGAPAEFCGNNIVDSLEECDDGNRTDGDGCDSSCRLESLTCGNGSVDDVQEECDQDDLGGTTCQSLGFDKGILFCGANCRFNISDCRFENLQHILITPNAPPQSGEITGELLGDYLLNLENLAPGCVKQEADGDVIYTVEPGHYCNLTALIPQTSQRLFRHLYIPEDALDNAAPIIRFYKNGDIRENMGGQIGVDDGLQVGAVFGTPESGYRLVTNNVTLKVTKRVLFQGHNPRDNKIAGRWFRMLTGIGTAEFCTTPTTCQTAIAGKTGEIVVNLENPDVIEIISPPKKNSGCNISTSDPSNNASHLVFPLLMAILFLFATRRRRK